MMLRMICGVLLSLALFWVGSQAQSTWLDQTRFSLFDGAVPLHASH